MANHMKARLPWGVDRELMELLAREALRSAFGECFKPGADDALEFAFELPGQERSWNTSQVWSQGPRHVEARHGCRGLAKVAQAVEFDALCACFGADVYVDEGVGRCALDEPGRVNLAALRLFGAGFEGKPKKGLGGVWLLGAQEAAFAREQAHPALFGVKEPKDFLQYASGAMDELDQLDWGAGVDWAAAVESRWPAGKAMGSGLAGSALLPSAALGKKMPPSALKKASRSGLERALAVALAWGRASSASEVLGRLRELGHDPSAALEAIRPLWSAKVNARVKALKDCDPAAREKLSFEAQARRGFEAAELEQQALAAPSKKACAL